MQKADSLLTVCILNNTLHSGPVMWVFSMSVLSSAFKETGIENDLVMARQLSYKTDAFCF